MFNLRERHIVVVLVLIAVIFLLFLSTRTPMCVTEGYSFNDYNSIFKIEQHNSDDLNIQDSEYDSSNRLLNQNENSIIQDEEKEVKPIVLSKNQMHEYKMNEADVLEDKFDLKQEKITGNKKKDLNKIKSKTVC